jgi:hypothetical protein
MQMGAGAMGVSGGSAILSVGRAAAPPGSSVEQRLQALEEWVPLIVQRSDAIERRLIDESTNRAQSDADERTARQAADDLIGHRLEASATGGLRLSAVGLTWLIFGTLFSGFPPEIASLVHPNPNTPYHLYAPRFNWVVASSEYFVIALGFSVSAVQHRSLSEE